MQCHRDEVEDDAVPAEHGIGVDPKLTAPHDVKARREVDDGGTHLLDDAARAVHGGLDLLQARVVLADHVAVHGHVAAHVGDVAGVLAAAALQMSVR